MLKISSESTYGCVTYDSFKDSDDPDREASWHRLLESSLGDS